MLGYKKRIDKDREVVQDAESPQLDWDDDSDLPF